MGRDTLETDDLEDLCVYWEQNGIADDGPIKVRSPIEIPCRWVEVARNPKSATDETLVYDVQLPTDRYIPDGSIFWHGELQSLPHDPTKYHNLYRSVGCTSTPDLRNENTRYVANLIYFGGTLPEINND